MNSHEFLKAAKEFAEATRSNVAIDHFGIRFTVRYVMGNSTAIIGSYLECGGLEKDEAERVFHALYSPIKEAGND